jgi:disulfide oxidoreductase YuzD
MHYGPSVEIEYVDLTAPEAQAEFSELVAVVEGRNLPYPLVAINGRLRLAGSADYYQIMPYVEEALALKSA